MCGLFARKAFKVVRRNDIEDDANVLGGRFVLAIKNMETDEPTYKARFVVQGHNDCEKNLLVHSANTIRQHSVRLLVALSEIFNFTIWSQDVYQDYLQAAGRIKRNVFIKPPREFQLTPDELLMLLKPLYGLNDAGDCWNHTFVRHLREDLARKPTVGDLSLFTKVIKGKLIGLTGSYVDDTI